MRLQSVEVRAVEGGLVSSILDVHGSESDAAGQARVPAGEVIYRIWYSFIAALYLVIKLLLSAGEVEGSFREDFGQVEVV